ncbi:MAG: amidohydrolase/deacetylase family metallohydrolase [Chloroflexi bacterium]|nr:amidohydrolase/deacetylase family metallohydrolase [Chloroflexota bacterium]
MYDLLIKGGKVIDPSHGIHGQRDIGVSGGKIAAVIPELLSHEAKKVIDARGKIVTPGLIDLHLHVAEGIFPISMAPDKAGVLSGVTTVCDGGSAGYIDLPKFKNSVAGSRTDVLCCLNICSGGISTVHDSKKHCEIDAEATLKAAVQNRGLVKGIKLQVIASIAETFGISAVKTAKQVAHQAGIPLTVHIGDMRERTSSNDVMDDFTRELLPLLDRGDVLLHVYTWEAGGVIKPDGSIANELREAVKRGVAVDVSHGMYHFSFEIARIGLAEGILPTTISTDLSMMSSEQAVFSLPVTMSKFLALGLSLDQVVEMTTVNPARILHEGHRRGALKVGMPADISVLEMVEGDFVYSDGKAGNRLGGKLLLKPVLTVKSGVEILPESFAVEVLK